MSGVGILVSLLDSLLSQLAKDLDAHIFTHGVPEAKAVLDEQQLAAWRGFPRCCALYAAQLERLASVAASVQCEQLLCEIVLQWAPPGQAVGGGATPIARSQFDLVRFQERVRNLVGRQTEGQLLAGQGSDVCITELAQSIMAIAVRHTK